MIRGYIVVWNIIIDIVFKLFVIFFIICILVELLKIIYMLIVYKIKR